MINFNSIKVGDKLVYLGGGNYSFPKGHIVCVNEVDYDFILGRSDEFLVGIQKHSTTFGYQFWSKMRTRRIVL